MPNDAGEPEKGAEGDKAGKVEAEEETGEQGGEEEEAAEKATAMLSGQPLPPRGPVRSGSATTREAEHFAKLKREKEEARAKMLGKMSEEQR